MLEWLTRDPLNGLVITSAFFISLIIGRYLNEQMVHIKNRGKIIEPRIRLILAVQGFNVAVFASGGMAERAIMKIKENNIRHSLNII